jgi:hypothetical protein
MGLEVSEFDQRESLLVYTEGWNCEVVVETSMVLIDMVLTDSF